MDPQIGDYRLDHLIGQGATGEVWLAWDEGAVRRPVAVKRVRWAGGSARAADLAAEAEVLAGIHHPHLVPVIAVVDDGDALAIVMPYLAGGSLAALLEERGTFTPGEVVAIVEPLADAVDALARRGILHGDLKPGNVMLTGDGEPVLIDVGIARVAHRTSEGRGAGTPEYLDPATAQGQEPGPASEVYSLAVLVYECLTGRLPHRGEPAEVVAVAAAGVHRRLHSWPSVPKAVADVVEAALDPDPTRRPPDAGRFAALLRSAVEGDADQQEQPDPIALPGITRSALAAPELAAGRHTVVIHTDLGDVADLVASRSPRWWHPVAALAVGAMTLLAVGAARSPEGDGADAGPAAGPAPAPATSTSLVASAEAPDCPAPGSVPEATPLVASAEAVDVRIDVDGDGCPDLVRWDGTELTVAATAGTDTRTYRLGRPGDQVLFGDWDGDGSATPAVYRPATGEVLYVDRFPSQIGDRETAVRVEELEPRGTAEVRAHDGSDGGVRERVVLADPS